jgi:hypothetical protein
VPPVVHKLTLSFFSFFLHSSFGSSFGEEAAAVRQIESIRIRKGGNISGISLNLSKCNNNQLLAIEEAARIEEVGDDDEVRCYRDGRGKLSCMPELTKLPCEGLVEKWGITAYC